MKKTLVILLPLLAVGWYLGLGGCLLTTGRNEMRSGSVNDYMESDVSQWIAIPPSATNITTYRFLAFDTNHRYLMATIQPESTDLAELCSRSMDLQDLPPHRGSRTFRADRPPPLSATPSGRRRRTDGDIPTLHTLIAAQCLRYMTGAHWLPT